MKIQVTPTGQVIITIPRSIARAMRLEKGDEVLVQLTQRGNIELVKVI
jgi:bifunctional DNA-binding transcriptional regulator/antitoxin component of YhaV-PrlF toxin-antitoxin module